MARLSFTSFRKKWLGKSIGTWSSSKYPQCVDLVRQWMIEGLGFTSKTMYDAIPRSNAEDFFARASTKYFRKVKNTPSGIPPEGAIVVLKHGKYGHVFIAKRGGSTRLMYSLDQNWSRPHKITDEAHRYTECIGWLIRR